MNLNKKGKIIFLAFITLCVSSCAGGRGVTFRRVNGHKVWVPNKQPKLKARYERCYNFSN